MTISAYDRHGSDEHSAFSEEQLTDQLEAGDQIEAKPAAPKKPSRSKKATAKKASAKKASDKKASVKKTGAKKVAAKKAAPSAQKQLQARKTSSTNKKRLAGEKQLASQQAEAAEQLQAILFANAKLQAFLELQDKADARKNRQQKAGKTDGSATGLLWTLSALALAACGGGGDDVLVGGAGADRFILDASDSGTDVVTDFKVADGDKIRINTANGSADDTIAELNRACYYIRDNGDDTNITDADNRRVYMTLNNVEFTDITDSNFDSYFEII